MLCGKKIPPCFGFIMVLESKIPISSKLQLGLGQEHCCFTWLVPLPASQSWAGAVQSLLDVPAGRSRSPTSAASLYLDSNREQEQTLSCRQRKYLPSGTHGQLCSFCKARMDTAPAPLIPTRVACTPPWSAYRPDLHCCTPNRASQHNPQG